MAKNDVGVDIDLLQDQVSALLGLFDRIDVVTSEVRQVRVNQDSSTWSTLPTAYQFGMEFRTKVFALEQEFQELRNRVIAIRTNLHESAAEHAHNDEMVEAQFKRFESKPSVTPYFPPGYSGPVPPSQLPQGPSDGGGIG